MQLGQSRTLPVEKPEQIDLAQAARYFGARGEADTATMALLQRCAVPLLAAATPRAVWLRAEVKALTEAGILRGSDVMQKSSLRSRRQSRLGSAREKRSRTSSCVPGYVAASLPENRPMRSSPEE